MWSTENKYFYYKIFHIKILSCWQALVLGLLNLFKPEAEVTLCRESGLLPRKGSGVCGLPHRVLLLCLQQVPLGEEL